LENIALVLKVSNQHVLRPELLLNAVLNAGTARVFPHFSEPRLRTGKLAQPGASQHSNTFFGQQRSSHDDLLGFLQTASLQVKWRKATT
jgi:hypothetical protein